MSQTADKFIIRLPDGMREQISEAAKANERTMNAEVVARLKLTFDLDQKADDALVPDFTASARLDALEAEVAAIKTKVGI